MGREQGVKATDRIYHLACQTTGFQLDMVVALSRTEARLSDRHPRWRGELRNQSRRNRWTQPLRSDDRRTHLQASDRTFQIPEGPPAFGGRLAALLQLLLL